MLSLGSEIKQSNEFELVIQVRDNNGNATGRKKSFVTNDAAELELLWNKHSYKKPRQKSKKKPAAKAAFTDSEISHALEEVESHVQQIRKERRLDGDDN